MLQVVVVAARELNATRLVGVYHPTAKNGMVREHFAKLGFSVLEANPDGSRRDSLDLAAFAPAATLIEICEG